MRRIALWNTAFLGDAVLTLPLIQSLRLRYPEACIDFYVRKGLEDLFDEHPAINTVYAFDKKGRDRGPASFFRAAQEIARRKYDLWISAHASPRSALMAAASRAQQRIGYNMPRLNRLVYTDTVDRCFAELDEIERLLRLLEPLGPGPVSPWPEVSLADYAMEHAAGFFSCLQGPVLGMHPGSVWPTKRWPAAYFADIGLRAVMHGAHVVLFAGPGEEDIARDVYRGIEEQLPDRAKTRLHDLSGALSLPLLAAYINRLDCYLTNDSGPMHLAWALHTPVTALFGPTVKKLGFFPRGEHSTVFEEALPCRPCGLHGPKSCPLGHHHCMTRLLPEPVWGDVRAKLGL